jgi:Flp pilus assembly protein TadD
MPHIKDFPSRLREARKLLQSIHEQASRTVAENAQLVAESHRKIAAARKLIEQTDSLLKNRPGAGKR